MATLTSPSLGKLITNVRNQLNSPNPNNSFWTDAEITEYLNKAVARYYTEVVQTDEGQFTTKSNLDIVANTETVALPTDCFIVKALRKKISDGFVKLNYYNSVNDSYSTVGGTNSNSYFPYYFFRGNNLVLRATPNFSETAGLELEYIQFPDVLQGASDTLNANVVPIFKELIEMYAVYKAKEKESMVSGVNVHAIAQEALNSLYNSFKEAVSRRSMSPTYITPFSPESE